MASFLRSCLHSRVMSSLTKLSVPEPRHMAVRRIRPRFLPMVALAAMVGLSSTGLDARQLLSGLLSPVLGLLQPVLGLVQPVLGLLQPVLGILQPVLGLV